MTDSDQNEGAVENPVGGAVENPVKETSPLAGVMTHEPVAEAAPAQPAELPQATLDEINAGKAALNRHTPNKV